MKRVKFAIVGVGGFGARHASTICCLPEAELVCVCDIKQSLAMQRADAYNCTYYTDYKEMLSDGGFDCVVVATGDQMHAEIAVAALEAGYHVLCEKPLALTHEDCLAVVSAARKSGKICAVGQSIRKSQGISVARDMIRRGDIGEVFSAELEYSHNYARLKPEWRKDKEKLRYPIIGGGCHVIDTLRWVLDEDPEEVIALSNHKSLVDWPVDDCTIALLKMPSGAIAKITCSIGIHRNYTCTATFCGTDGTIEANPRAEFILRHKKNENYEENFIFDVEKIPIDDVETHKVELEIEEICRAIKYGESISCDALEGAKTVAVGLAAVESARLGGVAVRPNYDFD